MQTQITCPQCNTAVAADIHQLIDVDQVPQFKQMLMQGALNVAQCRNCGWTGQVASPFVYHESAHDLLISFVPMELNMPYDQQEKMMGQMVRAIVENVPMEKRRAYLLQPQQMMRWQTFMETILGTEGITKEMIARQQKQGELMQKLSKADNDVCDYLLAQPENARLIDEQFIGMVQNMLQQAVQAQATEVMVGLSNLNARLLTTTDVGKRMEEKQIALQKMGIEAKAEGGVSPPLLLKHVLQNQDDDEIIDILVSSSGALSYEFFAGLSARIDDAAKAKDGATVDCLTAVRTRLLALYDEMRKASELMVQETVTVIDAILAAENRQQAIAQNAGQIDELFMNILEQQINQARQNSDLERTVALQELQAQINGMMEQQMPPEMMLISQMLEAQSAAELDQIMDANAALVGPDLLQMMDMLAQEIADAPDEVKTQFGQMRTRVSQRVLAA